MESFGKLGLAIAALAVLVVIAIVFAVGSGEPSDSLVKGIVKKQMEAHFKGCSITSMTVMHGKAFPLGAHESVVRYGTILHPVVVRAEYTVPQGDGSRSETREYVRVLNLYKDATRHWLNDADLH